MRKRTINHKDFNSPSKKPCFSLDLELGVDAPNDGCINHLVAPFIANSSKLIEEVWDPYSTSSSFQPGKMSSIRYDRFTPTNDYLRNPLIPVVERSIYTHVCIPPFPPKYTGDCFIDHEGHMCDCRTATPFPDIPYTSDFIVKYCECPGSCIYITHKDPECDYWNWILMHNSNDPEPYEDLFGTTPSYTSL